MHFTFAGLTVAGFTTSGIAAGSVAAATQSAIGNVAAGSVFAGLQSFGALGGFVGMAVAGLAGLALSWLSHDDSKRSAPTVAESTQSANGNVVEEDDDSDSNFAVPTS